MQHSEQINELAAALAKAQGAITPAIKDASNEAFKRGAKVSKYADIASVWEACRGPLSANGLSVVQQAVKADNHVTVTTRIFHASGQWLQFDGLSIPMAKPDAHGVGSATTYGRRFSLSAALGVVADEDDDGNTASGKGKKSDDPVSPPPPPGVSLHKTAIRDAVRELNACQDGSALLAYLPSIKDLAIKSAKEFPDQWHGIPEEPDSGFRGMIAKAGVECKLNSVPGWLDKIDALAK
jgi:hypothetical protein